MVYDPNDTIAAIGSAAGPAARGLVRVSGPRVIDCLSQCFTPVDMSLRIAEIRFPSIVAGSMRAVGEALPVVPCDLFLWPDGRSYTRQPTAELHTLGSPPLLDAVLHSLCRCGARLAEPGEFTLRAFLAGRVDLTQAEAVLGVVDARSQQDLNTALAQLAGGLSRPLARLREQLLQILAELEAGLDFVDEDIEFISRNQLRGQLAVAEQIVAAALEQMATRQDLSDLPRVVLVGPPNVGKSSLFNALVEVCADGGEKPCALVSERPGTTRDYVTAVADFDGVVCELVDTAGEDSKVNRAAIDQAARSMTDRQRNQADLIVQCVEATSSCDGSDLPSSETNLVVRTKADLLTDRQPTGPATADSWVACSSVTRDGLDVLRASIRRRLVDGRHAKAVASTAARCAESLRQAGAALGRSLQLVEGGGEELLAAEIRNALTELGRVVGAVTTDDVLDRIFSQFCIGK